MDDSFTTQRPGPLAPHFLKSLLFHGAIFLSLALFVMQEKQIVLQQEHALIEDIRAQEAKVEEAERLAREDAVKDMLREQLQFDLADLVADELEAKDEEKLLAQTQEDIDQRLEDVDADSDFLNLTEQELDELLEMLRTGAFEQLRLNLEELQKEMLLGQVRGHIRRRVVPHLQYRIESEIRHQLGEKLKGEVSNQLAQEEKARADTLAKRLSEEAKQLRDLKQEQEALLAEVNRTPLEQLVPRQKEFETREAEVAVNVRETLEKVGKLSPPQSEKASRIAARIEEQKLGEHLQGTRLNLEKQDKNAALKDGRQSASLANEQSRMLDDLARNIQASGADRSPDDIQRATAEAALPAVEAAVKKEVETRIKEQVIPATADKMTRALEPDLARLRLDSQQFKDFVKKDIQGALEEGLRESSPAAELALMKARQAYRLQDPEALEAARKEIAALIQKLEQLTEDQAGLRQRLTGPEVEKTADQQAGLAFQVEETYTEGTAALRKARNVAWRSESDIAQAEAEFRKGQPHHSARTAAEVAEQGQFEESAKSMAETEQNLASDISRLRKAEKSLEEEAAEAKAQEFQPIDLDALLGEEEVANVVGKVRGAAERVSEANMGEMLNKAVSTLDVRDVLSANNGLAKAQGLREKLDQVAQNAEEGRDLGTGAMSLAGTPSAGIQGAGMGIGLGAGESQFGQPSRLLRKIAPFDREAYEEFIKDLKNRMNPDNYYRELDEVIGLESAAAKGPEEVPAKVFVDSMQAEPKAENEPGPRDVPLPSFKYKAFGAAAMLETPIVIDGDLSDWGELHHPIRIQYRGDSNDKLEDGPSVFMRWSPDGLYFGYTTKDTNGIQPNPETPYFGDCLEVWIDMVNSRLKQMEVSPYAHQFCFTPFGYRGNPQSTFAEIGRDLRGLRRYQTYADEKKARGWSAAKIIPGYGYSVEAFLKRRTLAKPALVPGRYIAVQFSVNVGFGNENNYQWSASKLILTWNKPDTWGDVLLLGSDASARFVSDAGPDKSLEGMVPGEPLTFEITDKDMNINTLRADRVAAELQVKGVPGSLFVVLKETGADTGVFRGSVGTQPYFMPAKDNTLNIRAGDTVELVYRDARSEYGEKDRGVTAAVNVGWPTMTIGKK